MIGFLKGTLISKKRVGEGEMVLLFIGDTIGYWVTVPARYCLALDSIYGLYIHHHQTQDSESLYGFKESSDIEIFQSLIKVSGVGPKAAISILNSMSFEEVVEILENADVKKLSSVHSIGRKTAQKIILELQGILDISQNEKSNPIIKEAKTALRSLGYSESDIENKISNINIDSIETVDKMIEALLKAK